MRLLCALVGQLLVRRPGEVEEMLPELQAFCVQVSKEGREEGGREGRWVGECEGRGWVRAGRGVHGDLRQLTVLAHRPPASRHPLPDVLQYSRYREAAALYSALSGLAHA